MRPFVASQLATPLGKKVTRAAVPALPPFSLHRYSNMVKIINPTSRKHDDGFRVCVVAQFGLQCLKCGGKRITTKKVQ